jgi:outer membrane lipoprotein SlyB
MNVRTTMSLLALVPALALVSGCGAGLRRSEAVAQAPGNSSSEVTAYGRVSDIDVVDGKSSGAGGLVLGAVLGGVIGHQIGSGTGRDVATGLGAVGGALIGRQIQKRNETDLYRVTVRLDNGTQRSFDYQRIDDLKVGDRVRIDDGQIVRL